LSYGVFVNDVHFSNISILVT